MSQEVKDEYYTSDKLHGTRLGGALALLPVLGNLPRIFSLGNTKAVLLFVEIEARRAAGGSQKERAGIGQAGIERG